ncbi:MAG: rod shape-determining protein MreC [Butyrivibrio sp.]|nr:rod shape-determining protein MreC [Butyrivibrio sp.]
MRNKLKKIFSAKVWMTVLVCICFFFIGLTFFTDVLTKPLQNMASTVIIPLQKGVNGIGLWLTEKSDLLASVEELQDENKELRKEIERLEEDNLYMQLYRVELEKLRELYDIDNTYADHKKVGANVIGKSADNWYSTFTIDKGSDDGIEVDMNVIAGNGLVGIVASVSDKYSIVRSIIDDSSNVSAMLINSFDICTVSGDLQLMENGCIALNYLDKDVRIRDGDMIVTSNISEKYLEGILIGYAKDVKVDANNLTQSGYVVPAVDFKHISDVLVILDKKITVDE